MSQQDLTKGHVMQTMSLFALPMILGNLLQQGYNIVDTWAVGHFVGPKALAAVGAAFALMTFLTSVLLGLCMGSGTVFSLCFGRHDHEELKSSICASILLLAAASAILTGLSLFGVEALIAWMQIPQEITHMTEEYLRLVFLGIPAIAAYNFFAAYLKAVGNSVIPLAFLGVSTVSNIVLDLLFVAVFYWGTFGAAAATVISQYLAALGIGIYVLTKEPEVRLAFCKFRAKRDSVVRIANYSVLTCMQQSVMNLGILLVQGLVNSFGTVVMAAFAAAVKIEAFAYMPAQEYANAFSTFIAQNKGAGQAKRVAAGIRCAAFTVLCYCLAVSLLICVLVKPMMLIFIKASQPQILAAGIRYLRIVAPFYCGIGCLFLFYGLYRALGKPGMSVVLTVISLGTRVALAYTLAPAVGVAGIWWAIPIGWGLADLAGWLYYRCRMRG
ncbi:MAG: MATE family efflux transporter [Lachnospiraceae bacterium]|nr:MATE family efflux transporter [Lachnospiraceae bacterium]